jgi:succinate dehydrogenase/fumarate reductase-like Fe-S protein
MQATLKIQRFNPEADQKPHWEEYQVEVDPTDRLLDALQQVKWYQDGSLAFRRSCAHGVCGSDAMTVNSVNRLACKVLMQDLGAKVTVEPLRGFPIIKDLIVDMEPFFDKYRSVKPYFVNYDPASGTRAPKIAPGLTTRPGASSVAPAPAPAPRSGATAAMSGQQPSSRPTALSLTAATRAPTIGWKS